jgi:hypothetical protein
MLSLLQRGELVLLGVWGGAHAVGCTMAHTVTSARMPGLFCGRRLLWPQVRCVREGRMHNSMHDLNTVHHENLNAGKVSFV